MIIKGSNQPIILIGDESLEHITKLSCALYNKETLIKIWDLDSVEMEEDKILLPLTESETKTFPECRAELEVKWVEDNNIEFAEVMPVTIRRWRDETVMIEGDSDEIETN